MLTINLLLNNTPFLKTSMTLTSDPLNTLHVIVKKSTPDGGRVTFCPHVKDVNDDTIGGDDGGGDRCGSPVYKSIKHLKVNVCLIVPYHKHQ